MNTGLRHTVALVFANALSLPVLAEGFNINPGMWEMTFETRMTGGPPEMAAMVQQTPRVMRECVRDNRYKFHKDKLAKGCSLTADSHGGDRLTYAVKCNGDAGRTSGHGEVNFNGDTISGWSEMSIDNGSMGTMHVRDTFKGKRIGACE